MTPRLDPLPPGHYTITIDRVRKVRNQPAYTIHATMDDGRKIAGRVTYDPSKDRAP
ncbi:hypothetical protein Kuura_038 [Caulobacter phage Kuura]|nr:hypothetical protein Kuura_038 [Caulobacter phage Kuura]